MHDLMFIERLIGSFDNHGSKYVELIIHSGAVLGIRQMSSKSENLATLSQQPSGCVTVTERKGECRLITHKV
jgi:hypothetical protein